MAPKLYMIEESPPVRAVLITANVLGVQLELQKVDMLNSENLKPEYLKINPLHTVPVLDDDGYILVDSHAINAYLVTQYGKKDNLYPKDPKKRGLVDQRLYFDSGILFPRMFTITKPLVFRGENQFPQEKTDNVLEAYGFLNTFLEDSKWVAGDEVTIADFSIFETARSLNVVVPMDGSKYPNISRWLQQVDQLPETEVARQGFLNFESLMKKLLEGNNID